jgi:hypothetical protein
MRRLIFYDKIGTPMVYMDNGRHIFSFSGEPLAYIHDISIYNYEGKHLGFYKDGWIRDPTGKCVLFTKGAIEGPEKRTQDIFPVIAKKNNIPNKKTKESLRIKFKTKQEWSDLAVNEFFNQ